MIYLTINADDFGSSHLINTAIDTCFRNDWIDRTTIMVNMPGFDEAVALAKTNGYFEKVGCHINLIEGVPLTEKIKGTIFCNNGIFNGKALRVFKNRFFLSRNVKIALHEEIDAQIEKYLSSGFELKHIDSHEHTHTNWSILPIVLKCAKKNGINSIRLSRDIPKQEISLLYRIYKHIINKLIMSYNKKHGFVGNAHFGSQDDVTKILDKSCYCEMMVHPTLNSGKVVDAFNQETVEQWLNSNQLEICRKRD